MRGRVVRTFLAACVALLAALPALARDVEAVEMAGRRVWVWRPATPGPHPLVIFSHGLLSSGLQSRFLMRALAELGYLVLAPDHRDALRPDEKLGRPDTWTDATYRDRAADVRAVLDFVRAEPWAKRIDRSRIALAGHSLGGYTALGLGGAWRSWKLPGVRAVLALSPYAHPFVNQKTIGGVDAPVMLVTGTRDIGVAFWLKRAGGAFDQARTPAYFVELRNVGHFSFTDVQRGGHESIVYYSVAFLDRHVKGDERADPTVKRADVVALKAK